MFGKKLRREIGLTAALLALSSTVALAQDCSPTDLATAEQSYSTAYQMVTAGQWADAIPSLEMAVNACATHWQSLELLAQASWRSDKFPEAVEAYGKLVDGQYGGELAATDLRILEPYGYVLLRAQMFPEAQEVLESVLTMDPQNYRAHELLVHRFERSGMTEEMIPHLEAMHAGQADEGKRGGVAKKLGDAYKKIGDNEKASQWFSNTGGASTGLFNIGVDHMKKEQWNDAATAFSSYLGDRPESAPALKNLGQCYQKLGRNKDAREAYERVLAIDPNRHDVVSSLGFLYLDAEMYNKAGQIAQNAVASWSADDGKLGGMFYLMGKVLEKRDERYEEAITYFQKAISDSYWGGPAKKEITRQNQLIEIREMKARKGR